MANQDQVLLKFPRKKRKTKEDFEIDEVLGQFTKPLATAALGLASLFPQAQAQAAPEQTALTQVRKLYAKPITLFTAIYRAKDGKTHDLSIKEIGPNRVEVPIHYFDEGRDVLGRKKGPTPKEQAIKTLSFFLKREMLNVSVERSKKPPVDLGKEGQIIYMNITLLK